MSGDPYAGAQPPGAGDPGQPGEEELRAAYEAELSRITSTDMMAQAAVSLLNIAARRLGPPPGTPAGEGAAADRDLEQVRDAIDAVRALLEILERRIPTELRALRDALSQIQLAYAREMRREGAAPAAGAGAGQAPGAGGRPSPGGERAPGSPQAPGSPAAPGAPAGGRPEGAPPGGPADGESKEAPGPAESSGRLWIPGR